MNEQRRSCGSVFYVLYYVHCLRRSTLSGFPDLSTSPIGAESITSPKSAPMKSMEIGVKSAESENPHQRQGSKLVSIRENPRIRTNFIGAKLAEKLNPHQWQVLRWCETGLFSGIPSNARLWIGVKQACFPKSAPIANRPTYEKTGHRLRLLSYLTNLLSGLAALFQGLLHIVY